MRRVWVAALGLATAVAAGGADAGELSEVQVPSAVLGGTMDVILYQPDGVAPPEGWPVLYLLHGHDGNAHSWPDLGDIQATLDRMIAAGTLRPLLAVMPDAGNSWYVDSKALGGPGDFETALVRDLPEWVEANFPVRGDRAGRAIAGLSMGGFGALRLALAYPERYAVAASLSGALWQNVPAEDFDVPPDQLALIADNIYFHRVDRDTIEPGVDLPSLVSHFGGAFGTPFDPRKFNAENVFTLVGDRLEEEAELPALYVTVGDDDGFQLWRGAMAFFETVRADGRPVELRVTGGDHLWSLWKVAIVDALGFIDASLASGSTPAAARP